MRVYTKLRCFETAFYSDPYVEVGTDGNDKKYLMAEGMTAIAL